MEMKRNNFYYVLLVLLFSGIGGIHGIFAADITIPSMELITRADFKGFIPDITTRGKVDIDLTGGYKFGGGLSLGFNSSDLSYSATDISLFDSSSQSLADYLSHQTYLTFQAAHITLRDIFSKTTSLTYFIGDNDTFCSGEDFPLLFGSYPIATRFRGYLYFPSNEFNGIHRINGTGIKLTSRWDSKTNLTSFYLYKDGYLSGNYFSSDIRTMFNFENLKLEGFIGSTFPKGTYGTYRGGILFDYRSGDVGEFMAQVGIPLWDPEASFGINRLFFLFEPRINFNLFSIILTLFWHPGYYLQEPAVDTGSSNVHLNFMIGDLAKTPVAGGVESSITFDSSASFNQFSIVATPYLSAVVSGSILNFMLNINLFPFTPSSLFEGVIGIKAAF